MALSTTPRSVTDATRFTQNTPHASSKASASSAVGMDVPPTAASGSRFSRPAAQGPGRGSAAAGGGGPGGSPPFGETAEQRVARLRAAHLAAKKAQVSRFDAVIARGRRFFDSAHKLTVMGLLGLTAIAGLATVYTAFDMIMYNRKRKAEFIEAQKRMAADSLEAARLAYMTGKATEEQIALVEEAMEREAGHGPTIFKAPSILGAPNPADPSTAVTNAASSAAAAAAATTQLAKEGNSGDASEKQQEQQTNKAAGGWRAWLFSNLKQEEEGEDVGTSERRLGWESLSEEDEAAGVRNSDLVRAVEDKQAYLRAKAHQAFQQEKENQRKGGPLDRVGLQSEASSTEAPPKKKGWLW
ncbi:hypothetical protein VTK73DRAFT_7860 [Phialemonium thermophilum]|uniref:Cytochrome oxidase c assembly-domain-containing protein n=1 Tax=Phialemonium thermophilum TaxID=223376 RepID=A0ABR3WCT7_9PEZI